MGTDHVLIVNVVFQDHFLHLLPLQWYGCVFICLVDDFGNKFGVAVRLCFGEELRCTSCVEGSIFGEEAEERQ